MEAQTQILDKERINEIIERIANEKIGTKIVPPYNVFSMWNMSENDHTKILLALMRYKESNDSYPLIYSFLERFAKGYVEEDKFQEIKIEFNASFPKVCVGNVEKDSLIDGLITFNSNGENKAVIIENKIYDACDQKDQIRRYIQAMKREDIENKNILVFYITGDGSKEVEERSYKKDDENEYYNIGNNFVELNYKNDITAWLKEKVLDARKYPEALTSVIRAYVESLEKDLFNENSFAPETLDDLKQSFNELHDEYVNLRLYRSNSKNEYAEGKIQKEKYETIESQYNVAKGLVQAIEKDAFEAFKKCSVEILNKMWKEQLGDDLKWIVKHRNIIGKEGFIQIRLDNEWLGAHLEWVKIDANKIYNDNKYELTFHVEPAKEISKYGEGIVTLFSGKNTKQKRTRRLECNGRSIAELSEIELKKALENVYNDKFIIDCCKHTIEYYKKAQNNPNATDSL